MNTIGWIDALASECRFASRSLKNSPTFTVTAVATLALAIGANTAMFSVVNQFLLQPLPYHEAGRLVAIDATRDYQGVPRPGRVTWPLEAADRWQASLRATPR